jgi:hypothetical protein
MLSRIISIVTKVLCLSFFSALSACNESEGGKSWNIFSEAIEHEMERSPKELSISNLEESFAKNYVLMMEMVDICEKNPAIRRIGAKDGKVSFYGEGHSPSDFETVIDTARSLLSVFSASAVDCGRRGDVEGNPLAVVSFLVYSSGLSISGSSSGIVYKTDWSRKSNPISEEEIQSRGYTDLDKEGWYVYKN